MSQPDATADRISPAGLAMFGGGVWLVAAFGFCVSVATVFIVRKELEYAQIQDLVIVFVLMAIAAVPIAVGILLIRAGMRRGGHRISRLAKIVLAVSAVAVAIAIFAAGWLLFYPNRHDPKNIGYVLWKAGLYSKDLDEVAYTMVTDPDRFGMVLGKTESELRSKFGYLRTVHEAGPPFETCYAELSAIAGKRALFIRHDVLLVVFNDHGKAIDLINMKDC